MVLVRDEGAVATAPSPAPVPGRGTLPLAVGLAVGVALPVLVAWRVGALSIPHNDAWSYSRIGQTFARTGHVELLGWNRSTLLGQIVPLGPFGRSIEVQSLFVAALGVVALLAAYALAAPHVGRARAGVIAMVVGIFPSFGALTTSFMTDVPSLAATLLCLAAGDRAVRRDSPRALLLATLAGLWAVTIRPQAYLAALAVLAVAWHGARTGTLHRIRPRLVVVVGVVATALAAAYVHWWGSLPASDQLEPVYRGLRAWRAVWRDLVGGAAVTGLASLPLVTVLTRRALATRRGRVALGVTAALAGWTVAAEHVRRFLLGNYVDVRGPDGGALGGDGRGAPIYPTALWAVVVVLAAVGMCALVGAIVSARPRWTAPLLFTAASLAVLLGSVLFGQGSFERYWLPFVPALLVAALAPGRAPSSLPDDVRPARAGTGAGARGRRRVDLAVGAAATLAVVLFSTAVATSFWAYDRVRWDTAVALEQSTGLPATRIDAGMEWDGYHSPNGVIARHAPLTDGWMPRVSDVPACVRVSVRPLGGPSLQLVETVPYRAFLVAGRRDLLVYDDVRAPGCG